MDKFLETSGHVKTDEEFSVRLLVLPDKCRIQTSRFRGGGGGASPPAPPLDPSLISNI